jgi:hypothetical protein
LDVEVLYCYARLMEAVPRFLCASAPLRLKQFHRRDAKAQSSTGHLNFPLPMFAEQFDVCIHHQFDEIHEFGFGFPAEFRPGL